MIVQCHALMNIMQFHYMCVQSAKSHRGPRNLNPSSIFFNILGYDLVRSHRGPSQIAQIWSGQISSDATMRDYESHHSEKLNYFDASHLTDELTVFISRIRRVTPNTLGVICIIVFQTSHYKRAKDFFYVFYIDRKDESLTTIVVVCQLYYQFYSHFYTCNIVTDACLAFYYFPLSKRTVADIFVFSVQVLQVLRSNHRYLGAGLFYISVLNSGQSHQFIDLGWLVAVAYVSLLRSLAKSTGAFRVQGPSRIYKVDTDRQALNTHINARSQTIEYNLGWCILCVVTTTICTHACESYNPQSAAQEAPEENANSLQSAL